MRVLEKEEKYNLDLQSHTSLWRMVIVQALIDARSMPLVSAWFSTKDEDFITVCALASMCPKETTRKKKKAEKNGYMARQNRRTR